MDMFLRQSCLLAYCWFWACVDVMDFLSMWNKTDRKMRPSIKRPLNNQVWSSKIPALLALNFQGSCMQFSLDLFVLFISTRAFYWNNYILVFIISYLPILYVSYLLGYTVSFGSSPSFLQMCFSEVLGSMWCISVLILMCCVVLITSQLCFSLTFAYFPPNAHDKNKDTCIFYPCSLCTCCPADIISL